MCARVCFLTIPVVFSALRFSSCPVESGCVSGKIGSFVVGNRRRRCTNGNEILNLYLVLAAVELGSCANHSSGLGNAIISTGKWEGEGDFQIENNISVAGDPLSALLWSFVFVECIGPLQFHVSAPLNRQWTLRALLKVAVALERLTARRTRSGTTARRFTWLRKGDIAGTKNSSSENEIKNFDVTWCRRVGSLNQLSARTFFTAVAFCSFA